jgi:hypothetical protein
MNRLSLVLLASLFLYPDARAQAMRPAPAPVPLIQQQPPSLPGNPVHTPAGAGASHGGLPGAQKATLPSSPNKRLLPPTKEAGLWAADGAKASLAPPPVYGVELPYAPSAGNDEKRVTYACAATMSQATVATGANAASAAYPAYVRECLAFAALEHCADWMAQRHERMTKAGEHLDPDGMRALEAVKRYARALVEAACSDFSLADEQLNTQIRVYNYWGTKMNETSR